MAFPKPLAACALAALLAGCASAPVHRAYSSGDSDWTFRDGSSPQIIQAAEERASPAGAKVLAQARQMTAVDKVILPGACWDYVNAVYNKAGYPERKRKAVFKGKKKGGPYAKAKDIQGGDWLYFINHSYGNIEHSSMFVAWSDKDRMEGWLLSYAGEQRQEPARYKLYVLDNVYQVIRPQD